MKVTKWMIFYCKLKIILKLVNTCISKWYGILSEKNSRTKLLLLKLKSLLMGLFHLLLLAQHAPANYSFVYNSEVYILMLQDLLNQKHLILQGYNKYYSKFYNIASIHRHMEWRHPSTGPRPNPYEHKDQMTLWSSRRKKERIQNSSPVWGVGDEKNGYFEFSFVNLSLIRSVV